MSMYAKDDIRSALRTATPTTTVDPSTPIRPAQLIEFPAGEPGEVSAGGSRTWFVRATNAVLAYTEARAGDLFPVRDGLDEYALLMYSESAPVRVTAGADEIQVNDEAMVIIPPGESVVKALADGVLIRLFSAHASELLARAVNAGAYEEPDVRVTPLGDAPGPVGGSRLRVHLLSDHPLSADRFGRIFRTSSLMVNFVPEEVGPRNPQKLSPHFHDDFEQLSFAVKGRFVHHIRYPWGPDSTQWRPDEVLKTAAPSVCIIPPPTVHTTRGIGELQQLLDIFAPPREDFGASGWVLNAHEYPDA